MEDLKDLEDFNTSHISTFSTFKQREPKENQQLTRNYDIDGDISLHDLETVNNKLDWKLFILLASLEKIENFVHLFIIIWDDIPVRNNTEFSIEFNEETNNMIQIIEELNTLGAIDDLKQEDYCKNLDDYRNYRHQNQDLRRNIVNNAWAELESCGFERYSYAFANQLERCTSPQKKDLRSMVFSRIYSFRLFAIQIQRSKKETTVKKPKDGKQETNEIIRENENLKNQVTTLANALDNLTSYDDDPKNNQEVESLLKENENLNNQITTLANALDNLTKIDEAKNNQEKSLLKENERLKNKVATLVNENLQKSALVDSTIVVPWNEEDSNNTTKLISDIKELQDMLLDFTMVQGNDYKINNQNAENLLKTYKCQVNFPSTRAKLVLEAVLQHRAITLILENAQRYLQYARSSGDIDPTLESDIVNATETLIKYIELFKDNREGEDDVTRVTPIKIRQHAYSALSCRGLSSEHPLIKEIANNLLNEMNKIRQVVDKETRDELHGQAIQITRGVIDLFCFRLKTQAFEPTYRFFQAGQDVDTRLMQVMQGAFRRDDIRKLEVEVCGFPCIGILDGDKSNQRVFTKAQVITRKRNDRYIV